MCGKMDRRGMVGADGTKPPGHGQLFYFLEWLDLPLDSSVLHLR